MDGREEVIEYNGVSIRVPQGCGFGVARKDGSLTLTVEKPCNITVFESALGADGGKRRSKRRSVGTPGSDEASSLAATFASDSAPAAPRRRTRSRTQASDEPASTAPVSDEPADANSVAITADDGADDGAAAAAEPAEAQSPASKLAAAEATADEEEWRWRSMQGAPTLPRWGHSVTRVDDQLFILGGENADECFNSGHIYQHTEGRWSFDPIPARQGPFGHRAWHAIESFFASDDMDGEEDGPADKAMAGPAKLLLFGGETVNPESGDRMCTNDCLIYDTEYNVWCVAAACSEQRQGSTLITFALCRYEAQTSGQKPGPRSGHAMARIDKHLYVFGGCRRSSFLNDLFALNTETMTWSKPSGAVRLFVF
jgi:hypothetical protein